MENLNIDKLNYIENFVIDLMKNEINTIVLKTRKNMVVVEEKSDGDSATIADIEIGKLFEKNLINLLPNSIIIQEESFDEKVFYNLKKYEYIWVIDPIDGTRAFRDINNSEWCIGCCLLENLNPIFSAVYIPEPWLGVSLLLTAHAGRKEVYNFGTVFYPKKHFENSIYISHIHRETERSEQEKMIAKIFSTNEIMRAYAGHSTLAQILSIIVNPQKIFSRRQANIWDVIQSAYIIQKCDCEVFYEDGINIFPLNLDKLEFKNNHLILPFVISSSSLNKEKIISKLQSKN